MNTHLALFGTGAAAGALYMNQSLAAKPGEKELFPTSQRLALGALTGTLLVGMVYLALTVYSDPKGS